MKLVPVLFVVLAVTASCNLFNNVRIRGNKKIVSKHYELKDFKSIDVGGAKTLYLTQDSVCKLRVETDENLLEYIQVVIRNGELNVEAKKGYWLDPSDEIKLFVSMPLLKKLSVSGASEIQSQSRFEQNEKMGIDLSGASEGNMNVRAPEVKIEASGASTLTITGETRDMVADVSGASTLEGYGLKSENATVDVSGASTARVFASLKLNAGASGASNVIYKGNPSVTKDASGASDVKKAAP